MQPSKSLGQVGYEAYADAGTPPGVTFDGRAMPTWSEVGDVTRGRWEAAASKIVRMSVERALLRFTCTSPPLVREYFEDDLPTTQKEF